MTVWPFLLAGSAACAYYNWRAGIIFALAVCVGQATTRLELTQLHLLAGYSVLAIVACFFFERYSGFVLATFGLVIGAHILGFIGHLPKVIAGEVLLFAGMIFCAFNGPSGGLWTSSHTVSDGGSDTISLGASQNSPQARKASDKEG